MPDDKKILPYGLKDTKEASQPDQHKLSAFQVAPTRKTAFERAREQAQQKAEREAEETAAAYESFVAEYGTGEDPNVPPSNRTQRQRQEQDERFQRHQRSAKQVSQYASFDDVDSEEEERERKRLKLKSGASYLNELKTINQKRERYDPRQSQPSTERGREPIRQTQSIRETPRAAAPAVQETAPDEESSDEIDFYRSKPPTMPSNLALSTRSKARLKFLLNSITAERFAIAGVTAFAMTHSSCIDEITYTISASITEYAEDWKTTIARLWCISDILHNSWLPIPNVWKYRSAFEIQLVSIFKHLRSVADSIESRIRRENFRRLVTSVLDVWDSWICFGDGVVETFYAAFDDKPVEQVEVVAVKPEKKSGGWKKLGETAQAVVEAKKTPEREPDMNVDGEAIDLDGEEIDLDGEAVDLDEPIETAVQSSSVEEANATTPNTTTTTMPATAPHTSKIKMSFGKFKLPSRAVPQAVAKQNLQDTTTSESSAKQTGRPAEAARRARPSAADFM